MKLCESDCVCAPQPITLTPQVMPLTPPFVSLTYIALLLSVSLYILTPSRRPFTCPSRTSTRFRITPSPPAPRNAQPRPSINMLRRVSTAVTLPLLLSLSPVRSADYPPDIGTVISHSYANFSGNALCTATAIGFFNYTIVASGLFIVQNGSDVIQDIGTGKETRWFYVSDFNTTIGQPGTTRADCVPIAGQYVQDKDSGSWLIEDASTTQTMLVSVITDEAGKASTAPGIYNDNETTTLQYFLVSARLAIQSPE